MIKGSSRRQAAWPIDALFLDRWSPRSMTGEALSEADLLILLEAARWAPSSMNFQPWRFLYARRDTPHWHSFLGLLNEKNRIWAQRAGALVLFVARTHFDDGRPCPTHSYDTGAAWQNLALQAWLRGLAVHGIKGFDHDQARAELRIPAEYSLEAMAVIGHPAEREALPAEFQAREQPNDRRPLSDTATEGPWRHS